MHNWPPAEGGGAVVGKTGGNLSVCIVTNLSQLTLDVWQTSTFLFLRPLEPLLTREFPFLPPWDALMFILTLQGPFHCNTRVLPLQQALLFWGSTRFQMNQTVKIIYFCSQRESTAIVIVQKKINGQKKSAWDVYPNQTCISQSRRRSLIHKMLKDFQKTNTCHFNTSQLTKSATKFCLKVEFIFLYKCPLLPP